ncbi:MAG: glycosyltransferase [Candidatus Omnitrophota bacterium]|jgi:rhamnosyltransferase
MPADKINQYPDISIVILSKNSAPYLKQALEIIFRQQVSACYEVLVIDSGSTDSTLETIRRYPIRLVTIPPEAFGHGRTRNLGARLAKGKIVVFLNGDAIPSDELWLYNLIRHFDGDPQIAGVYGRCFPRQGCNPLRARELLADPTYAFKEAVLKRIEDKKSYTRMDYGQKRILLAFETISCAIKRDILQRFEFDDNIEFGEDLEWSKRMMEKGFKIVFEPSSAVVHSHDFYCSLRQTIKKFFDDTKLSKDLLEYHISITPLTFLRFVTIKVIPDIKYISGLSNGIIYKIRWILYCPLVRISQFIGVIIGCYSQKIPLGLHRRISLVSEAKNSSKNLWG